MDVAGKWGEETTDERARDALPEGGVDERSTQNTGGGGRAPINPAGERGGGDNLLGWPLDGERTAKKKIYHIILIGFKTLVVYVELFDWNVLHPER